MTYGACTTISVYENLSKNSFFICARKPTPPYSRSRSRFASAKVGLFCKPAKKHERKFKKITKNGCRRDNKGENTPYLYYIYLGSNIAILVYSAVHYTYWYTHTGKSVYWLVSSFKLFTSLFYILDSTSKWYHTVFVFLYLIYFT